MRSVKLIVLILLCGVNILCAQRNYKKIKFYNARISFVDKSKVVRGVLYKVTDSSVIVSNTHYRKDYKEGNFETVEYLYNNIKKIKLKKSGFFKSMTLIGLSVGLVSGLISTAFNSSEDEESGVFNFEPDFGPEISNDELFIGHIVLYGTLGAAIGACFGRSVVRVNGDIKVFNSNNYKLQKYSIVYQVEVVRYAN